MSQHAITMSRDISWLRHNVMWCHALCNECYKGICFINAAVFSCFMKFIVCQSFLPACHPWCYALFSTFFLCVPYWSISQTLKKANKRDEIYQWEYFWVLMYGSHCVPAKMLDECFPGRIMRRVSCYKPIKCRVFFSVTQCWWSGSKRNLWSKKKRCHQFYK